MTALARVVTEPISSAPDPRIESALKWCSVRGLSGFVLAAPFHLDPATLAYVREQPQVRAILRWPGPEQPDVDQADGRFLPDDYSWQLPRPCPRTLVFIDGRGALTARMLAAALRHGVRRIVFTEGGTWRSKSLPLLALGKLFEQTGRALRERQRPWWRCLPIPARYRLSAQHPAGLGGSAAGLRRATSRRFARRAGRNRPRLPDAGRRGRRAADREYRRGLCVLLA